MIPTPRILCIGTHHKCGTVWMRRVWRLIGQALDIPMRPLHRPRKWTDLPEEGRVICVNWSSRFAPGLMEREDARFLHIIRDPRDVLLSGARYHETAPGRQENFLHVPNPDWNGRTYQQQIRHLPTREEKLAFEMAQHHASVLAEMTAWPYGHPRAIDLRYEDLIEDTDCAIFGRVLDHFGFQGAEHDTALEIYHQNSLFGGLKDRSDVGRLKTHVSSGKTRRWLTELPPRTAALYLERHGDDLIKLGYESDRTWLDKLRPDAMSGSETQAEG
ncbi:hypothetical protein SAMN05444007_11135 [Cribrihabitans marinus]|uniref:Sulfotransferase domain-containing protein n=1 Tax=Cribrihabitans marinus TaxID=1227549 RepID=A0A1H7DEA7_9RHOB|nr:hypothetical protein [Cribrihabitans marinus]GGH38739.1 hypothetical protein GCM10010973_34190 [Cribrihabitans marinus]SEK00141.1 hypothetical protein SAMN05444007_11135 [Cribrihabitans marinus]